MAIHLVYFKSRDGTISLPPTDDTPCPPGYMRCEANTLDEVDKLQKQLQQATYERCQRELQHDEEVFEVARQRVIDSLHATLASAATSEYEKEFIRGYIKLRNETKREDYRKRFACDVAFLELRENDKPRNAEELLKESL